MCSKAESHLPRFTLEQTAMRRDKDRYNPQEGDSEAGMTTCNRARPPDATPTFTSALSSLPAGELPCTALHPLPEVKDVMALSA